MTYALERPVPPAVWPYPPALKRPKQASRRTFGGGAVALGLVLVLALSACVARYERHDQALPYAVPEAFEASGEASVSARWWEAFGDPGLDEAVQAALGQNLELRASFERIRAAEAASERAQGGRRPTVDATAGAGYGPSTFERDGWFARVGVQAQYEVDLWRRVSAGVEAEVLRTEAIHADHAAAAISVAAEVTLIWVQMGALAEQLRVLDAQQETNTTVLRLLERRFQNGIGATADVLRQRALVEATLQERAAVSAERAAAGRALSVLVGVPPSGLTAEHATAPVTLVRVPALPAAGVPTGVVERRPDVQRALLAFEAADRDVAVAAAERLPRLTLTAGLESAGASAERLFRDWALSVAGGLLAPLFRGGALRAEEQRTEAVRMERWYDYCAAVLDALLDVEDALALEAAERERIARISARVALYEQSVTQLERHYYSGGGDYLDVLSARSELQRLERELVDAHRDEAAFRVALYRALAGPISEGN